MRKSFKKLLPMILALALILGAFPFAALAADSGTCGSGVNWSLNDGTLAITGSGEMADYSSSNNYAPWDELSSHITKITVAAGVTKIGNYAFYGLTEVTSVELKQGLITIGNRAFMWCSALTELEIPASVENIISGAFNSTGLQKVTFKGSSISAIGSNTFGGSGKKGVRILVPSGFTVGGAAVSAGKPASGQFAGNYVGFTDGTATVFWENDDGSLLETDIGVAAGATPTYDGETPVKAASGQYVYTFDTWAPAVGAVSGNEIYVYKAAFTQSEVQQTKYTVTWLNWDGSPLDTDEVPENGTPEYDGVTPTRESTATAEYTFSGWSDGNNTYGLSDTLPPVTGDVAYTAQFDETPITHEHVYGDPVWTWNSDNTSATAVFTCTVADCGHEEEVTDESPELTEVVPADCENDQIAKYVAEVVFLDVTYNDETEEFEVANTSTGHTYGDPVWIWDPDNTSATAVFSCACGHEEDVTDDSPEFTEVTPADCENDQTAKYVAEVVFLDVTYNDETEAFVVENTKTGHTYGDPTWEWEDETLARATFICASGDSIISVSANASDGEITSAIISEATEDADGLERFTATVEFEGKTYSDIYDKAIPYESGDPDEPGEPDTPDGPDTPDEPDEPSQGDGLCKWCGEPHTGFWGKIVAFFHSIFYFFAHLFGLR